MKKLVIGIVVIAALAGVALYAGLFTRGSSAVEGAQAGSTSGPQGPAGAAGGRRGGGPGGRGGRGGAAGPLTVEVATVTRAPVTEQLVVVGNLVGDTTVSVVPRTAGRLQSVLVKLGDPVRRGQRLAKIEDFEIREQVKQAEAAQEVSRATIRQREADLRLAETNAERSRNLFARQLLPKQTLDDTEARYQAAVAQLDLARAQNSQSNARLDELRINLENTNIISPVDGFVARRAADPGAFASQNAPVVDVVDIRRVRLVVNIVEKDLGRLATAENARVEVDAFPGEAFDGRIARMAPVLDPATRTSQIEIEIPNPSFRLKPGMYARVTVTTRQQRDALVVPPSAVVDNGGRRGVFLAAADNTVAFRTVRVGIEEPQQIEILDGVEAGDRVVTTGAASLQDGARIIIAAPTADGEGGPNGSRAAAATASAAPAAGGAGGRPAGRRGGVGNQQRGQRP